MRQFHKSRLYVIEVLGGKETENKRNLRTKGERMRQKKFEEIMVRAFPNLVKDVN